MNQPNFFIVGVAKSGTTSLWHYLNQHPEICMSSIKEPNFFSANEILAHKLYYDGKPVNSLVEYESLFVNSNNAIAIGEASVSYFAYSGIASRIKEALPESKIIVVMRNPIDRAYSHYLMDKKLGFVDLSFDEIVTKTGSHSRLEQFYFQHIEVGLYSKYCEEYLNQFGAKNMLFLKYEELFNINASLKEIYNFLNINSDYNLLSQSRQNTYQIAKNGIINYMFQNKTLRNYLIIILPEQIRLNIKKLAFMNKNKPEMSDTAFETLQRFYKLDIQKTMLLTGLDLNNWLQSR